MAFCLAFVIALLAPRARAQSFEAWSAKAEKAQKKGDETHALEYWSQALRVWSPDKGKARRAKALAARAALEQKGHDEEQALKDLDEALALDKKSAAMFDRRGLLHLDQGDTKKALADFYSATKLNMDYGPAYQHRAQAYEKQDDTEFAREDYRTACRLGVKAACASAKTIVVKKAKAPEVPPELARAPQEAAAAPAAPKAPPEPAAEPPAAEPEAPAAPPAAKAPAAKTIVPAKPKTGFVRVDLDACRAAVDSCNEDGNAIGVCLQRVKTCQAKPTKGCCPRACIQEFERRTNDDVSDAELFRDVFGEHGTCRRLIGK